MLLCLMYYSYIECIIWFAQKEINNSIEKLFHGNYCFLLRLPLVTSFGMYRLRSNTLDDLEAANALAHAIERMTNLHTLE